MDVSGEGDQIRRAKATGGLEVETRVTAKSSMWRVESNTGLGIAFARAGGTAANAELKRALPE
jgi:hypothetical protein